MPITAHMPWSCGMLTKPGRRLALRMVSSGERNSGASSALAPAPSGVTALATAGPSVTASRISSSARRGACGSRTRRWQASMNWLRSNIAGLVERAASIGRERATIVVTTRSDGLERSCRSLGRRGARRMAGANRYWTLADGPVPNWPEADTFVLNEGEIPRPGPGQALSRTIYVSLDPYQWGYKKRRTEPAGSPCHARTVSQIIESNMPGFAAGDLVFNTNGWTQYALMGEGVWR